MNYSEDKTYGRKIIRGNVKKYRRRLVMSWGICFLIGFLIGSILVSGVIHIFSCTDVVNAEVAEVVVIEEPEPTPVSLGKFKLTAYCACFKCCGKHPGDVGYGITKSGVRAIEDVTVAADPNVIPLGTEVIIDGHEYIVQDTGSAIKGNRIDIYFEDHQEALEFGVQYKEIFTMKEGETYDKV
jgi:3D (Asp-Asp-Asp) domain-containing protein